MGFAGVDEASEMVGREAGSLGEGGEEVGERMRRWSALRSPQDRSACLRTATPAPRTHLESSLDSISPPLVPHAAHHRI